MKLKISIMSHLNCSIVVKIQFEGTLDEELVCFVVTELL